MPDDAVVVPNREPAPGMVAVFACGTIRYPAESGLAPQQFVLRTTVTTIQATGTVESPAPGPPHP